MAPSLRRIAAWAALAAPAFLMPALIWATPAPAQISLGGPTPPIPKEHAEMVAGFGGPMGGPAADWMAGVGERMATAAGRSGQCAFHLLNSEIVNAFTAPPGCHVYVTRGLIELVNTEGEVAAVIGHEIGHVAANHAGKRQQSEQLAGLGAALLGQVLKSDLAGQIASQVGQFGLLSYSRNQEYEADDLSEKYLVAGGRYPPEATVALLDALGRQEALESRIHPGGQKTPSWARSHPLTADRVTRADKKARAAGPAPPAPADGERAFLAAIDGLPYGPDQKGGVVDGAAFVHPGLGIAFRAPDGYALKNTDQAVLIQGQNGVKAMFAGGALSGGSLETYAQAVMKQVAGQAPVQAAATERVRVNGQEGVVLPAQGRAQNGQIVDLLVTAWPAANGGAYHFVTLAPQGQGRAVADALAASVRTPTAAEASGGARIQVVTVQRGETVDALAGRMAFPDYRVERFRLINGLAADAAVQPGQRVKLIVTGPLATPVAGAQTAGGPTASASGASALTSGAPPAGPPTKSRRSRSRHPPPT